MNDLSALLDVFRAYDGWFLVEARLEKATCVCRGENPLELWPSLRTELVGVHALDEALSLVFQTGGDDGADTEVILNTGNLDFRMEGEPYDAVSIYGPKVRTEQKSKADGGGTREVPYDGLLLKLVHHERYTARVEAQRKADEAARAKAQVEAETRRIEEKARHEAWRHANDQWELEALRTRIDNATITKIDRVEHGGAVKLTFSNGRTLTLTACNDDCCPHTYLGIDDGTSNLEV